MANLIFLFLLFVSTEKPLLSIGNHYFTANHCSVCQKQKAVIKKLEKQGFDIQIHNYNKEKELFKKLKIKSVPIFIIVKVDEKGKLLILKLKGKQPIKKLIKLLHKGDKDGKEMDEGSS